ncbi:MAG: hydroxyacid dehydrogenase [Ruminococcaceae bacterium]|nr:hydroxyacid dehydrogenase [Oscillospiraceae bacterium]
MKILIETPTGIVRDTFFTPENVERINALGTVEWNPYDRHMTPEEFRDALVDVDVCFCCWGVPAFDSLVLEKANNLKIIAYVGGSVNHFATDEVYNRGIHVLTGNEEFARSVAEGNLGYIIAALRRLPQTVNEMAADGWQLTYKRTESLLEQNVGIVGLGTISRYLISYLKPFQCNIKLFSNHTTDEEAAALGVEKVSLEEMFKTCKIISVNSARTPKNYHMISDELMGLLRPDCLIVNTSRGSLIDEEAMARHLQAGHFRAILDVYEEEPLPMTSGLRGLENCILIPHRGGPTTDRRAAATRVVIDDVIAIMNGGTAKYEVGKARAATMTHI